MSEEVLDTTNVAPADANDKGESSGYVDIYRAPNRMVVMHYEGCYLVLSPAEVRELAQALWDAAVDAEGDTFDDAEGDDSEQGGL